MFTLIRKLVKEKSDAAYVAALEQGLAGFDPDVNLNLIEREFLQRYKAGRYKLTFRPFG